MEVHEHSMHLLLYCPPSTAWFVDTSPHPFPLIVHGATLMRLCGTCLHKMVQNGLFPRPSAVVAFGLDCVQTLLSLMLTLTFLAPTGRSCQTLSTLSSLWFPL